MSDVTAPQLAWIAAGRPLPAGKTGSTYRFVAAQGVCACCAGGFHHGEGVPVRSIGRGADKAPGIDNPTFSNHAEFLRWGEHVCSACAWLFGDPKRMHRSLLVIGEWIAWPALGEAAASEGRPLWADVLAGAAPLSPNRAWTGVLTTDPKPRLWPRMQVATFGAPGLYVHAPDYDVSSWLTFAWESLAEAIDLVKMALEAGWSRREIMMGPASPRGGLVSTLEIDSRLVPHRGSAELTIAALVTRPTAQEERASRPRPIG